MIPNKIVCSLALSFLLFLAIGLKAQEESSSHVFYDEKKKLYGIKDNLGNLVFAPTLVSATPFLDEGVSLVLQTNRIQALMDTEGKIILEFDELISTNTNVVIYKFNKKYGFYDIKNRQKMLEFEGVKYLGENLYDVLIVKGDPKLKTTDQHVLMDKEGNVLSKFSMQSIDPYINGLSKARDDKGFIAYVNVKGELIGDFESTLYPFVSGLQRKKVLVNKKMLWGYIDKTGAYKIKPKYVSASDFVDGVACVSTPSGSSVKYGLISSEGKIIISPRFKTAGRYLNGYHIFQSLNKKGNEFYAVPSDGKYIRYTKYSYMLPLTSDLFVAKYSGKKTAMVINKSKKTIVPDGKFIDYKIHVDDYIVATLPDRTLVLFDMLGKEFVAGVKSITPFYNDVAMVVRGGAGLKNLVNKEGQFVLKEDYDNIYIEHPDFTENFNQDIFYKGVLAVSKNKKFGFVNKQGELIVPIALDQYFLHQHFIEGRSDKKYIYYDYQGNVLFEGAQVVCKEVAKYTVASYKNKAGKQISFVVSEGGTVAIHPVMVPSAMMEEFVSKHKVDTETIDAKTIRLAVKQPIIVSKQDPKTRQYSHIIETKEGEMVLPVTFDRVSPLHSGVSVYRTKKTMYGIFNSEGKKITDPIYSSAPTGFKWGYGVAVKTDASKQRSYSVIDVSGDAVVDNLIAAPLVKDGMVVINNESRKQGVYFLKSNLQLPNIFNKVSLLKSASQKTSFVSVQCDRYSGLYNMMGKQVVPLLCESFKIYDEGVLVKRMGFYGLVGHEGEELIPFEHEDLSYFKANFWLSKKQKSMQLITIREGKAVYLKSFNGIVERSPVILFKDKVSTYMLNADGKFIDFFKNYSSRTMYSHLSKKNPEQQAKATQYLSNDNSIIFVKEKVINQKLKTFE